ncbi:Yip1 domain protein [Candidatus Anstonella stagnisolia]|nr:Yip1 domain protein [Candidatus Anstonella stagnisolia]
MDFAQLLMKIKDNAFLIPQERFDALTKDTGYVDSFVYLLACTVFSCIVYFALWALAPGIMSGGAPGAAVSSVAPASAFELTIQRLLLALPMAYISFGFLHLVLKLLGAKGGFQKSVQIFVYGNTGSTLFSAIPFVNVLFMAVCLVNVVKGSMQVHKLELWKAVVALVVVPVIVVFAIAMLVAGALMNTGALAAAVAK